MQCTRHRRHPFTPALPRYVIPTPVIDHFITDFTRNGDFTGFPALGVHWQRMESAALKAAYGMGPEHKGVLVRKVAPLSNAASLLKPGDIIMSFDNVQIASDGTVPFRTGERIAFSYLTSQKFTGEKAHLTIMRDGEVLQLDVELCLPSALVAPHLRGHDPSYMVVAGFVFTPLTEVGFFSGCGIGREWSGVVVSALSNQRHCCVALHVSPMCCSWQGPTAVCDHTCTTSHTICTPNTPIHQQPYLDSEFGCEYSSDAPVKLLQELYFGEKRESDQELVVLSQVLACDATLGYEELNNIRVKEFNGQAVRNLRHLAELVYHCKEQFLRFDLEYDVRVVDGVACRGACCRSRVWRCVLLVMQCWWMWWILDNACFSFHHGPWHRRWWCSTTKRRRRAQPPSCRTTQSLPWCPRTCWMCCPSRCATQHARRLLSLR